MLWNDIEIGVDEYGYFIILNELMFRFNNSRGAKRFIKSHKLDILDIVVPRSFWRYGDGILDAQS